MERLQNVDHAAIRTNQAVIIVLLVAAFIFAAPWLVAVVALVMLIGTAVKRPGFALLYTRVLRPLGLVRPDVLHDNPEPHRFAQGMGGVFLAVAALALYLGLPGLGWVLAWLVAALAGLNLFGGFCTGCAIYYWLHRLNVPGFVKAPPQNTFPGMRPRAR